ncbi:MAG: hypothetical protein WCI45_01135 [Desulfuromonadales bacterium]
MKKTSGALLVTALLCLCSTTVFAVDDAAGVLPTTMEKYKTTKEKVEALTGTAVAKRAPEVVSDAGKSIAAAQEGLKSGSDSITHEAVEKALLQITFAHVLAAERGAEELTAVAKAELEKQERRLSDILAGKGGN